MALNARVVGLATLKNVADPQIHPCFRLANSLFALTGSTRAGARGTSGSLRTELC